MSSVEFAYGLIAVISLVLFWVLSINIRMLKHARENRNRIKKLEGEMELMRTKINPNTDTYEKTGDI